MLSVVFSDSEANAKASQAQLGATWPTLTDNGGGIALDYGVRQLPSTFVIAPDGRVVAAIVRTGDCGRTRPDHRQGQGRAHVNSRRIPLWTALGVVLVVVLVIGSGVFSSSPPTAAQRANAIESSLRCPSCEDLSVAESSASTAVTVRTTIVRLIAEGQTDQQIESYLVDRYGSSIVLDPPASGWSLLVWLLPLIGGLAAIGIVGGVLIRRRNASEADPSDSNHGRFLAPEEAEERRAFLLQSLADADAEYLAGDLSDKDYLSLRHRDMVRLSSLDVASAPASVGATTTATTSVATALGPR